MIIMLKDWVLDWLWPRFCLGCGIEGGWLCLACFKSIEPVNVQVCPGCGQREEGYEMCKRCKHCWRLDGLIVCWQKNDLVKKIIYYYKYFGVFDLGRWLGVVYSQMIKNNLFDVCVYVPLNIRKRRMRGFNQSEIVAKYVAQLNNIELGRTLKRIKNSQSQVGLTRKERMINVMGDFVSSGRCQGRRVLLIDDVCTSMATLNECATVLKKSGAKTVVGIVLARGL